MNYFIKNIHINKLFHLNDIDISWAVSLTEEEFAKRLFEEQ